jgi:hypothetical protein
VVIFRGRLVALVLGVLGALGELLGAFAGLRLGAVARAVLVQSSICFCSAAFGGRRWWRRG